MMLRHRLTLGLALVAALITSIAAYSWLNDQPIQQTVVESFKNQGTQSVAVALTSLPWGIVFDEEMVEIVEYPDSSLPEGYFKDFESLKGRVLLINLKPKEPILESKLAPLSVKTGGVAAVTTPGKRAMSVKVNEVVGVGGFIKPGDKVDVMVTIKRSDKKNRDVITKTVLENTLVLASGTQIERSGKEEEPVIVKYITLEVTPREAEKLALATTEGKIRLALRNPLNHEPFLTKGETIPSLLASYKAKPSPQKRRRTNRVKVEMVKGVEITTMKVAKEVHKGVEITTGKLAKI